MKKETLFKIIATSLPFLLLLLLEAALRIGGYGENYSLWNTVTIPNRPGYLEINPLVSRKYFKGKDFHADSQFDLFLRTKTDSTFRVFVMGASTVVGFPYYRGGSFPRMLKHRLSQTFPDKNIEVINTGITAINSYTLLDFTDEIVAQKPDLVIIYAGHNEYYGALGVGSSITYGSHPWLVRTYLSAKNLRIFQLFESVYALLSGTKSKQKISGTTLMEIMAKEQSIRYKSHMYQAGLDQFESNMENVLAEYKAHHIPVILSTLVSNEKDIPPFISDNLNDETQFMKALMLEDTNANHVARNNARAAYILGRHYLEINSDTARKYLHIAKELDLLRFRAPEAINDVIRNLAEKYDFPLMDMKGVFQGHSPQGIVGDELMTEHVHPNIKGYFIMADAFYNKIKALGFLQGEWDNYIPFEAAVQDIPVTQIDSIRGKFVIDDLKKSWPYDLSATGARAIPPSYIENSTYEQRRALELYTNQVTWKELMVQSYEKYNRDGDYQKGLRIAQSLILEYPEEAKLYGMAGDMCTNLNKPEKADYYFSKCKELGGR